MKVSLETLEVFEGFFGGYLTIYNHFFKIFPFSDKICGHKFRFEI